MIFQTKTTSFMVELFQAVHNFGPTSPDTFMLALYDETADLGASTTAYTATGEVTGTGYTPGGIALVISVSPVAGTNINHAPVAYLSFDPAEWPGASISAFGGLVYNATQGNKSVFVLNFGMVKTAVDQTFTVQFPTADADSAIIRIQ